MTESRQPELGDNVRDRRADGEIPTLSICPIETLQGMFKGYSGSLAEKLVEDRREDARRDEERFQSKAKSRSG